MSSDLATLDQEHFDVLRLAGTLDEKRQHIFLRTLAETGNMIVACAAAGYKNSAAVNRLKRDNAAFANAFNEALEAASDVLEAEAVRRALKGVKKDIYYKGEVVGEEFIYSDSLLAMLLKGAKAEKYQERSRQETNVNVRVGVAVIPSVSKKPGEWEAQAAFVHAQQHALNGPQEPVIDADFKEVNPGTLKRG